MLPIALQQNGSNSSDASSTLPPAKAEPTALGPDAPVLVPPSTAGMTTKVVKGSLWTLAGQVAPLAVSLVATPFTIRLLGAEGYGVLILVGLIPTYLGFADLGMGIASTKFGSEAYAAGDADKEARTVRTAAVLSLALSIPFAILFFAASGWLATLFNVPEHLHAEASLALKVAAFTFVLNFLNSIFNTPQLDRLRMDLNTFVTSGFRMLGIAATPIVIYLGGGILGAVVVLLLASLATLAGHIYVSGRLLPQLFDISLDRQALRPMLRFGSALVGVAIAGVILFHAEKGLLAFTLSVKALAYYSVAFILANMMILLSNTLIQSLVPAFSQLHGQGASGQFEFLFANVVKMCLIGLIPVAAFLFFGARDLIGIWAGAEFAANSSVPFYVLLGGLLFSVPGYVPYSLLMAIGKAGLIAKLYWLEIVPYLAIVYLLTARFGILGAAIAWSVRVAFDGLVFFFLANRTAETGLKIMDKRFLWLAAGAAAYTPLLSIVFSSNGSVSPSSVAAFLIATLCYSVMVWRSVLLPKEKEWLGLSIRTAQLFR